MSDYFRAGPDVLFFHKSTHECFTNPSLLEYRIRQREHGARVERDRIRKALSDPATVEAVADVLYAELFDLGINGTESGRVAEVAVAAVTARITAAPTEGETP